MGEGGYQGVLFFAFPFALDEHGVTPDVDEFLCESAAADEEAACVEAVVVLGDEEVDGGDVGGGFGGGPGFFALAVAAFELGVVLEGLVHGGVGEDVVDEGDGGGHEDGVEVEPPEPLGFGV